MPASFGVHGPGDSTIASGRHRQRLADAQRVVAPHLAPRADIAEEVDEVEGKAVVVVDQQDHARIVVGHDPSVNASQGSGSRLLIPGT